MLSMRGEEREEREGRKGGGVGPLSKQREVVRREGNRLSDADQLGLPPVLWGTDRNYG